MSVDKAWRMFGLTLGWRSHHAVTLSSGVFPAGVEREICKPVQVKGGEPLPVSHPPPFRTYSLRAQKLVPYSMSLTSPSPLQGACSPEYLSPRRMTSQANLHRVSVVSVRIIPIPPQSCLGLDCKPWGTLGCGRGQQRSGGGGN